MQLQKGANEGWLALDAGWPFVPFGLIRLFFEKIVDFCPFWTAKFWPLQGWLWERFFPYFCASQKTSESEFMSIIQKLHGRSAAIAISVIIGLALISFILMDAYSGRGRGAEAMANAETVGQVNGENIPRAEFEDMVSNMKQNYQAQGMGVDANMEMNIRNQVWMQLQDEKLLGAEYEKLGLAYTNKEQDDALFGANTPQWLLQAAMDSLTGKLDIAKAKQLFAQVKKDKGRAQMVESQLLQPMRSSTLRQKYMSLLTQSAFVPKWLVEKQIADDAQISNISLVSVPFASIADSTVSVSDAEIESFVAKNANLYKQDEETRSINYVLFDARPNAQDSSTALAEVANVKAAFEADNNPQAFLAKNNSSTEYFNQFISGPAIKVPYKDSIFKLGVGKVFGPYTENDNSGGTVYKLAKIIETKSLPDSVKAKHILVAFSDPQTRQPLRDSATAQKKMDSIIALIKSGQSFDSLAKKVSDDPGSGSKGGDLGYFSNGMMVPEFNDFCFSNGVGATKVVKTQFGLHYIQVTGVKPSTLHYKIAYMSRPVEASNETINTARQAADVFAGESRSSYKDFEKNLEKQKLNKLSADEIRAVDFSIMGVGDSKPLVKWMFESSVGDVSEAFEVGDKYLVAVLSRIDKAGPYGAKKARPQVEPMVRNLLKGKQLLAKVGGAKTLEDIAKNLGGSVQRIDSVRFGSGMIQGVGNDAKVCGAAFNKALVGKVSEAFAGNTGVFALRVENVGAAPTMANADEMRKQAAQSFGQMSGYGFMQALKKVATIKDMRER
jgi:peptidyl-prolyl cis-trans isomerase D